MKELVIKIKGIVPFIIDWDARNHSDRYQNGEGLYAVTQDEQVIGLIHANNFTTDANGNGVCSYQELMFGADAASDIAIRNREFELKEYITEAADMVIKELRETQYNIENAFAEVNEGVKKIGENGGNAKGITEKTLLSALSIVTRGSTDNGEVK